MPQITKQGLTRRNFSSSVIAAIAAASCGRETQAQQHYPTRPVRLILPFGAAGVADVTARLAAEKLGEKLGQRFVVENQPGPGGIAAARAVLSQPADGHTLGLVSNGNAVAAALFRALPYDPLKDFSPISLIGTFDLILASNAESEFKSLLDFISAARARPGSLNVGTINVGSTQHLGAALLKSLSGVDFQIIPYRASPDALVALLRKDVQLMVDFHAAMKSPLQEGNVRALATSGLQRSPFLPEVPTAAEAGVPGYEAVSWNGLHARSGTAAELISILNAAVREVVGMPEVKERYADVGIEAQASTPGELTARLSRDIAKWRALIERAGIPKQ
jgi:tripartite-type tricarboxylate transporter receptor subunit TctC